MRRPEIFATDLNDTCSTSASRPVREDAGRRHSPQRLRRFFVEEEGGYRVSKMLREWWCSRGRT